MDAGPVWPEHFRQTIRPRGMRDLRTSSAMYVKAVLLVLIGVVSSLMLLLRSPHLVTAILLAIAVWAFCRSYYFAFYVIERYIDRSFRFSGLLSALLWAIRARSEWRGIIAAHGEDSRQRLPPR
jgi:hypothetical protein